LEGRTVETPDVPGAAEIDAVVDEMLAEHRYRSRYGGLTHDEYLEEPAVVEVALAAYWPLASVLRVPGSYMRNKRARRSMRFF
jgi:hypothetical protein